MTIFAEFLYDFIINGAIIFNWQFPGDIQRTLCFILERINLICCFFLLRHPRAKIGYLIRYGIDCLVRFIHVTHENPFSIGKQETENR